MNLEPFPREAHQQFYDRNVIEVSNYILNCYGIEWRSAARKWGETDDQGIYAQLYYTATKLRHFTLQEQTS
jgi:hypothetical protein